MTETNESDIGLAKKSREKIKLPQSLMRWSFKLPGMIAIFIVRAYQYLISPLLGRTCRFHPSCSQYFILSVQKFGLLRALWKGTWRISRCHPWHPGGYDPP